MPLLGRIEKMWDTLAHRLSRQRDLEQHLVVLNSALEGNAESKRNLDDAMKESVEADPFGLFAQAARRSRF